MINVKCGKFVNDEISINFFYDSEELGVRDLIDFNLVLNASNDFDISDHVDYYQVHLGMFDVLSYISTEEIFRTFVKFNDNIRSYELEANDQKILRSEFYSNFLQHLTIGAINIDNENNEPFGKVGMNLEVSQIADYDKWNLDVSIKKIVELFKKCVEFDDDLSIFVDNPDEEDKSMYFMMIEMSYEKDDNIRASITSFVNKMYLIEEQVYRELDPLKWSEDYLKNEKKFSLELVLPLFRRLRFDSVKYTHGTKEYGKDIVCSYTDPIGERKYVAVQIKAGNMSGRVRSDIDEILAQLDDAMSIPFVDVTIGKEVYMSQFYILISGKYTDNAQHKIISKMSNHQRGVVTFIDQSKIMDLLRLHW